MYNRYNKLLEKDLRQKIINTFKVTQSVADWSHEIDDKLSIWITDTLLKELSKKVKIKPEVLAKEDLVANYPNEMSELKDKFVSIRDYIKGMNNSGRNIDFKNTSFETLYNDSESWHSSLKASVSKKVEDSEVHKMLKIYPPLPNGLVYYWADLGKSFSDIERERMGHCGNAGEGNNLISLRSHFQSLDGSKILKSHVTVAVKKDGSGYTQAKGKQNRKPDIRYRDYIFDLFMIEDRIDNKFIPTYKETSDWKVTDFSPSQIKKLYDIKPKLVSQFIDELAFKEAQEILNKKPSEVMEELKNSNFKWNGRDFKYLDSQIQEALFKVTIKEKEYVKIWLENLRQTTNQSFTSNILFDFFEIMAFENVLGKNLDIVEYYFFKNINWKNTEHSYILTLAGLVQKFPDFLSKFFPFELLIKLYTNDLISENREMYESTLGNLLISYMQKFPDKYKKFLEKIIISNEVIPFADFWYNADAIEPVDADRQIDNLFQVLTENNLMDSTKAKKYIFKKILENFGEWNFDSFEETIKNNNLFLIHYLMNQPNVIVPNKVKKIMNTKFKLKLDVKELFDAVYEDGSEYYKRFFDNNDYIEFNSEIKVEDAINHLNSLSNKGINYIKEYLKEKELWRKDFEKKSIDNILDILNDENMLPDELINLFERCDIYAQESAFQDSLYQEGKSYLDDIMDGFLPQGKVISSNVDYITIETTAYFCYQAINSLMDNIHFEVLSRHEITQYESLLSEIFYEYLNKENISMPDYHDTYYDSDLFCELVVDNWDL